MTIEGIWEEYRLDNGQPIDLMADWVVKTRKREHEPHSIRHTQTGLGLQGRARQIRRLTHRPPLPRQGTHSRSRYR